jgi:hypothetical protein
MDQVRPVLRYHHYAYRTEQTYCDWIVSYIRFHGGTTHPRDMGKREIDAFLSHLATKLSASTQRQALNAIIFLYRQVLEQPIEGQIEPTRAKLRDELNRLDVLKDVDPEVWNHNFVVNCQAMNSCHESVRYLAPYVFKVAISNSRIITVEDGKVFFRYRKPHSRRWRTMALDIIIRDVHKIIGSDLHQHSL